LSEIAQLTNKTIAVYYFMQTYQDKWITIPLKNARDKKGRFISRKVDVQFDWKNYPHNIETHKWPFSQ
jgi:hypothetical protein